VSEIGPNWTTKRRGFLLINPWYNDPCLNRYYFGPKIISLYRVFTIFSLTTTTILINLLLIAIIEFNTDDTDEYWAQKEWSNIGIKIEEG
jgi:hypothetical protein